MNSAFPASICPSAVVARAPDSEVAGGAVVPRSTAADRTVLLDPSASVTVTAGAYTPGVV
nr:hypothetical protein [Streptomyces murinus]